MKQFCSEVNLEHLPEIAPRLRQAKEFYTEALRLQPRQAGGTFVFDPSQAGTGGAATGVAAPAAASQTPPPIVAAGIRTNAPVAAPAIPTFSPFLQGQVENLSYRPTVMSMTTIDAVIASHRSAFDQTVSPGIPHSAGSCAWLAAIESSGISPDHNKTTASNGEALDKVLTRFGV